VLPAGCGESPVLCLPGDVITAKYRAKQIMFVDGRYCLPTYRPNWFIRGVQLFLKRQFLQGYPDFLSVKPQYMQTQVLWYVTPCLWVSGSEGS
jgi:hypothetical protein